VRALFLGFGQHAVETAQDGQRQNDVLVPAAPEGVADEVGDSPEKAHDLAMVHPIPTPMPARTELFNLAKINRTLTRIASVSGDVCEGHQIALLAPHTSGP
jgi:hypothetical protein